VIGTTGVNNTSGKFSAGINNAGGKLPLASTIPAISGCIHLRVNLKAKIYIFVNFGTQRCPNKIIKIFLIEDFFLFPPMSTTPVVHLKLRISLQIFEKI
jgi:hypothetical protein